MGAVIGNDDEAVNLNGGGVGKILFAMRAFALVGIVDLKDGVSSLSLAAGGAFESIECFDVYALNGGIRRGLIHKSGGAVIPDCV